MATSLTHADVEILERKVVYQGVFRMVQYRLRHKLFNGGMSNIVMREVMERKSAVAVLLYDDVLDRVVLIEQFRPGAFKDPESPWLLEIVAGVFGENEAPLQVATREAYEEAGCTVQRIEQICEFFVSPGGCDEYLQLYCAQIDASHAGGLFGLAEENEDIRTFVLDADEAFRWVRQGKIKTSPAIISLQWLELNRERLQKLWQKNP